MEWLSFSTFIEWMNKPLPMGAESSVTMSSILTGLIVFACALVISRVVQRLASRRLTRRLFFSPALSYAVRRILHYFIIIAGALLALETMGLELTSLTVILGVLGVGIGFGLQNVTSNFISGLILLFERPISVGHFVTVGDEVGSVIDIKMRSTLIRTLDNVSIIVPNSKFLESDVINWSYGDTRVRIRVPVGVAYGSDVARVTEALLGVAADHAEVLTEPEPSVRFIGFGDSSLDFQLLAWIEHPEKQWLYRSDLNFAIEAAFRREEIEIPFPQRDVHIRSARGLEKTGMGSGAAR